MAKSHVNRPLILPADRARPRDEVESKPTVAERAAEVPAGLPLGEPKAMQTLLATFSNGGDGTLVREFDTKTKDGHFTALGTYRKLIAAIGASIGELDEGAAVSDGQGIRLEIVKKARVTTDCKIIIPAEQFMQISAKYGFETGGKIDAVDYDRWNEIKSTVRPVPAQSIADR